MRNVSGKCCRENQNTLFVLVIYFQNSCRLWDNAEKYGRVREATGDRKYGT